MNRFRFLLLAVFCLGAALPADAQISVNLSIKRRTYLRYEPILATVSVTNLSGRELKLADGDSQWFGFQIQSGATENIIPPINPDYHLEALDLKIGETVKRTVNLNTLFALSEFGRYRIKATIYCAEMNKFFTSKQDAIDISEGRILWQQAVGVPEGLPYAGSTHTISLLAYQSETKQYLYARVEDREAGTIFCTHQLGHLIEGQQPQIQLDSSNNVYVLQIVAPKLYVLSKISVNGEFQGQTTYNAPKTAPYLRRLADGKLQIVGGRREVAQVATDPPIPKLSDRPINLPKK